MISIKKTDYVYRITLPKNKDINIVNVYNSLFFSIFPLKGLRVYKNEKKVIDTVVQESVTQNDDNNDENKLVNVFGKERFPNSYNTLPLANDNGDSKIVDNKKETNEENEDLYDTMSSYLTKYLPAMFSKENTDNNDHVIHITVPVDNNQPVTLLEDMLNNYDNDELYNIESESIDYVFLEKIIKDLYLQLQYLLHNQYVFSSLSLDSIVYVQNRFVIFDSPNIEILKENRDEQMKNLNKTFLNLISSILKLNVSSDELLSKLKNIQNTEVFYFLKRIEREGVMLWM
tara:strand:- start:291 stop:1151 length:861 start_codon:yes stop_codon:yes gene_type:complete